MTPRESAEPHLLVVFGATGDLSHRKLLPALFRLDSDPRRAERHAIMGVARAALTDDAFRAQAIDALAAAKIDRAAAEKWCRETLVYQSLGDSSAGAYRALAERIVRVEKDRSLPGNRIFNLALPLAAFSPTVNSLAGAGLNR